MGGAGGCIGGVEEGVLGCGGVGEDGEGDSCEQGREAHVVYRDGILEVVALIDQGKIGGDDEVVNANRVIG